MEDTIARSDDEMKQIDQNVNQKNANRQAKLLKESQATAARITALSTNQTNSANSLAQDIQSVQGRINTAYSNMMSFGPKPQPGATETMANADVSFQTYLQQRETYCHSDCNPDFVKGTKTKSGRCSEGTMEKEGKLDSYGTGTH